MHNWYDDVKEFHDTFGLTSNNGPTTPSEEDQELAYSLIAEEADEILEAMATNDMAGVLDGAIDLIYVALGMLVRYGIRPESAWNLVHTANMAKAGGVKRADGKMLKPEGWEPPDIEGDIEAQKLLCSIFYSDYNHET